MTREEYFSQTRICFLDDVASVASYVRTYEQAEVRKVLEIADAVVKQSFLFNLRWDMERTSEPVVFPSVIHWLYQPGDDSEWVFAFNRMRFWICLGQAYALTHDETYAQTFAHQLCDWVKRVKRTDPACQKAWRSIEAGLRMEYWTKAMQYFRDSPSITGEVIDTFLASVAEHARFLMSVWDSYHLMSNWGVLENHGLLLASLALPSDEQSRSFTKEALRRLSLEIQMQVYDDGFQWEQSPMYHNEVAHDYLDVVLLAKRLHLVLDAVIKEKTLLMCLASLALQKPDGSEPCMGDSDRIDQRDIITKGACLFEDGLLKAGGYAHLDFDSVWDLGSQAIQTYDRLPSVKCGRSLTVLQESRNAVIRTDAYYLRFHCGTLGAGHGHSDKLHFDLFANDEDVLVDAGRYTYVPKAERYEFKDSTAHNTTTVDHRNFTVCKDSWECLKLSGPLLFDAVQKGPYCALQGSHQGYLDVGVLPKRTIITLSDDLILICDAFLAHEKHSYQSYLHFNDRGKVKLTEEGVFYRSLDNEVQVLVTSSEGVTQFLKNTRLSRQYNQLVDNKTLVSEVESDAFASLFTLISLNAPKAMIPATLSKCRVLSNFKKTRFSDSFLEAVHIQKAEQVFTVVIAHQEWASPTDTFNADGCTGFGSVVVFDRAKGEVEIGTRLFC
ncbi:alginate lyase family protein [Sphaerochaeta sp.]|uniref:alginate lyase family protein n=1 Tax=Sphaerochaeta sp. TaxID=1972642 RepID=UPI002FCB19FE